MWPLSHVSVMMQNCFNLQMLFSFALLHPAPVFQCWVPSFSQGATRRHYTMWTSPRGHLADLSEIYWINTETASWITKLLSPCLAIELSWSHLWFHLLTQLRYTPGIIKLLSPKKAQMSSRDTKRCRYLGQLLRLSWNITCLGLNAVRLGHSWPRPSVALVGTLATDTVS